MTPNAIIRENEARRAALHSEYDPVLGIGSLIERTPIAIHDSLTVRVPVQMLENRAVQAAVDAGSLDLLARRQGLSWRDLLPSFHLARLQYDYPYWCACCVKIKNKEGKEVPLILNPSQRISVKDRETMRTGGVPVRQIELKHRQYGSTTEKNSFICWMQNVVEPGFNAYVISLDREGAVDIVERYDRIADNYPPSVGQIEFAGYMGARNTRQVSPAGGLLYLGSAQKPNAPSGRTVQLVLVSEAGKMSSTAATGADKLLTNIMSAVPLKPSTVVMIESTAESSGQWFRTEVQKAQNNQSGFRLTFISWLTDPQYTLPLDGIDVSAWIEGWTDYDRLLWEEGASLEQIHWYQHKEREYQQPWQMKQEFPTTPEEAFQYGEKRVFLPVHVATARKTCKDPVAVGRLVADSETGEGAFDNIRFEKDPSGNLSIWRYPGDRYGGMIPDGHRVLDRYAGASDVGGLWEGADYSVTDILDRAPRLFGGMSEVVAQWRGHLEAEQYAWEAARLCHWYDEAYWALEVNSMRAREREQREPDYGLATLDEIKHHYANLYFREVFDSVIQQRVRKAGWHTNRETKGILIASLRKALRAFYLRTVEDVEEGEGIVIRSMNATQEMDSYLEIEEHFEAAAGAKDDTVVTHGILAHLDQTMEPPTLVKVQPERRRKKRPVTAASI